jgi:hypothetical protein
LRLEMVAQSVNAEIEKAVECFTQCALTRNPGLGSGSIYPFKPCACCVVDRETSSG